MHLKIIGLNICTFGLYSIIGYNQKRIADYVDRHIEIIE